jgi:pimeloyl-ACP methyl ester carboxylesterase
MGDHHHTDTRPEEPPRFGDRYFNSDGLNLHYRDYAGSDAAPPILCLPGLTRNARDFATFAERYAPRFRVLALDFRGRALSDPDPDPSRYHPRTYAKDVIELLDTLAIERAIFVGTSLGGLVTMLVAAMAPDRIAAAVLNDIGPEINDAGLDRIRGYIGRDIRFRSWAEAAERIAANNRHLPARYSAADWQHLARRCCREEDGAIRFDYDMAIAEPFNATQPAPKVDMWPLFRALAAKPLLIIRGDESDLLSSGALEKMVAVGSEIASVTVAGVGHAPDLDEPESVAALDAFLGRWESGA